MAERTRLGELVDKLVVASKDKVDPETDVPWTEAIDPGAWYASPEYVSLHGTETWDSLDEARRKKLALHEAALFYSINIHGEKALIQGLAKRLYRLRNTDVTPYLHHFLDEENRHMEYFGRFCLRYIGKVYPDKKVEGAQEATPDEDDLLFFVKVMIFEELVDVYNCAQGWDDRLAPVAKTINKLHHIDEARHLIFGREVVKILHAKCRAQWTPERRAEMQGYFAGYLDATWREYYNPEVYRDVGLPEPFRVREAAWRHPACVSHRRRTSAKCVKFMVDEGILEREPTFETD